MTFSDSLLHSLSLPPFASVPPPPPPPPPPDHASSMALHKHLAPRMLPSQASSPSNSAHGDYFDELWHACAGPLVSVPQPRQLVMYLPQGHIEQISASTNQGADCQLPKPDLPPHVLCRVVGLQLSAEKDGDEVIAQLSLLPEPEGSDSPGEKDDILPSPKHVVHMFCKTLTASDTSTHGGFSVPRKHAVCLPPLDMTRYPPTQELVAKDLHGQEWRFRHIYRGQPKRHLLTTGWSVFVSQKRLQAGDAVIFLRGESGELRVGIRRAMRQQTTPPSSVLPSQSMHMGVIATVSHAILTRTMFSVYYKPRVSPAEFIIPVERFKKALSCSLTVGMRFKMKFETEDGSERRYTGTITGMNDFDPARWPESKWRSLKVGWDEQTIYERQDRVSPWEIEFSVAPSATPTPGPRNKRFRSNNPTPATDLSVPGRSKAALESMLSANFSTVLQGQELRTLGSSILSEEANGVPKLHHHHQHLHQHQQHQQQQQQAWGTGSDDGGGGFKRSSEIFWGISGAVGSGQECRGTYALDLAAAAANLSPHHAHLRMHVNQFHQQEQLQQKETGMLDSSSPSAPLSTPSRTAFPCFINPHYIADGNLKMVAHPLQKQSSNLQPQCVRLDGSSWQSTLQQSALPVPPNDSSHSWLGPLMPSSAHAKVSGVTSSVGLPEKSNNSSQQQWHSHDFPALHSSFASWESKQEEKESAPPAVENSCKIFGFSLTDRTTAASLPPPKPVMSSSEELDVVEPASKQQSSVHDVEHEVEQPPPKIIMPENSTASSDQGKPTANSFKEGQPRSQHAVRSCTKVIKKGSMVGRGVDLSKFDNYEQLFEELERMFHMIDGELGNPEKGWQVAYSDNEDDMLLVGDDPWQEFCNMVRKIHILRPEEVQGNKLLDNKTKGCLEEIHASNNSDHSDPQESSLQTVLGERGSVT